MFRSTLVLALALVPAACHSHTDVPGDGSDHRPFAEIAASEVLHFTGTEPFWGGQASGGTLTYTTPEQPDGQAIAVERFAGRGGLSFSGTLDGKSLDMTVTPAECSDGMSDRRYPYAAMLRLGNEVRQGCAWSDAHPFKGPEKP